MSFFSRDVLALRWLTRKLFEGWFRHRTNSHNCKDSFFYCRRLRDWSFDVRRKRVKKPIGNASEFAIDDAKKTSFLHLIWSWPDFGFVSKREFSTLKMKLLILAFVAKANFPIFSLCIVSNSMRFTAHVDINVKYLRVGHHENRIKDWRLFSSCF